MHTPILSSAALKNARQQGLGEQVGGIAERISSAISLGILSVGERLPTEIELAEQFKVAVATLRKALATLREQGTVETRRGRNGGTFIVRAPFPSADALKQALTTVTLTELRDCADEHAAISGAAAKLAAQRTPNGQSTRLAELAFAARAGTTEQERTFQDSRFHTEIAVLSHSQRLLTAEQRLQAEYVPLLWAQNLLHLSPQTAFTEHLEIALAIEAGTGERAQKLAEAHVHGNIRRIAEAKLQLPESQQTTHATKNRHHTHTEHTKHPRNTRTLSRTLATSENQEPTT